VYNLQEKKLDARTISVFFIGYPNKSKGYIFYCLNHNTRIVESGNARFIENHHISRSKESRKVDIKEKHAEVPTSDVSSKVVVPFVVSRSHNNPIQQINIPNPQNEHMDNEPTNDAQVIDEHRIDEPQVIPLKRSKRQRRPAITNDYVVYSLEHESDLTINEDPVSFRQAMKSNNFEKWFDAMKKELKSMDDNKVWDLVEMPKSAKRVDCKWVFNTKRDSKGNIERYKARLVAKGYTKKDGIDYKETFSPVSKNYSLRL